jgi:hypothetical protein
MNQNLIQLRINLNTPDVSTSESLWDALVQLCAQRPQTKDARQRYLLTTFAHRCGLGPTEAARHL